MLIAGLKCLEKETDGHPISGSSVLINPGFVVQGENGQESQPLLPIQEGYEKWEKK